MNTSTTEIEIVLRETCWRVDPEAGRVVMVASAGTSGSLPPGVEPEAYSEAWRLLSSDLLISPRVVLNLKGGK